MSDERLYLRIANDLAELARVAKSVDAFCIERAVPAASTFKLNAALEELLIDTISYGYADERLHQIALTVACEGQTIVAELSDDARPRDPLRAPPPDLDPAIKERLIGGLDLHLVKSLVDEVAYAYEGGRNRVTLRLRIAANAG